VSAPVTRPDPLRGLRGVYAGTLVMEAIVVGLGLMVVARLGGGLAGPAGWYTGALAVALLVAAFVQRRPWGLGLALVLQVAMVVGWFAHPAVGVVGLLFILVWAYLLHVRREVLRRPAA
jgi:ABC-type Co2+ transport system permease subunit